MTGKVSYAVGDVFEFVMDQDGNKGYGRIMKIDHPLLLVEIYKLLPLLSDEFDVNHIRDVAPLYTLWSNELGIRDGVWTIIGHLLVESDYKIPNFWERDDVSNKLYLILEDGQRVEITEDEIGDAQPAGIFGYGDLRERGMYPIVHTSDDYPPATVVAIHDLEQRIGYTLPDDYKKWMLKQNGGVHTPEGFEFTDLFGEPSNSLIRYFLPIGDEYSDNVLLDYEYFVGEGRLPIGLLPIAVDPFGNKICMELEDGEQKGTILFWDHELEHLESNLSVVAKSFLEFIQMLKEMPPDL